MFDTHCHLQDKRFNGIVDDVINNARRAGVTKILCCGIDVDDWADVARVGAGSDAVICAYGAHPWHVGDMQGDWEALLVERLREDPFAAVGEIGLDNAVTPRDDAAQAEIFTRQLTIAERFKRPASIHCRKAWGALLDILRGRGGLPYGGAIHSYSGSPELVGELQDLGCYISFSASLLAPNNKRASESIRRVSPDRLLVETDSPYMRPEPSDLLPIVAKAAEILGKSPDEIAESAYNNGMRLFLP